MDFGFFFKGLVIGFLIAVPVGPIGVLCIRRSLTHGHAVGFISGLGAATADAIYGCIAGFGLTAISGALVTQTHWLRFFGGLFLCYLGIRTVMSAPADQAANADGQGLAMAYVSTVFLTLTNPATILSFAAVFAGLGLAQAEGNYTTASLLVLGVFVGSGLWWLMLSGGVSLFRSAFTPQRLCWLNRISGAVLLAFGIVSLRL